MKVVLRLIAPLFAALAAQAAWAQAAESVKLRLALDGEGRLYLTTEPANYAPLPLLSSSPQPTFNGWGEGRIHAPANIAIDLRAAPESSGPCLVGQGFEALSRGQACDFSAYSGLPGAIEGATAALSFDSGRYFGFDLSYGLHWLDLVDDETLAGTRWLVSEPAFQTPASILLPGWVGPVSGETALRSESLGLGGFFWIGPDLKLNFSYEHASGALAMLQPGISGLLPWEMGTQDSVSVGLNYGRLQGMLIGRQIRPDNSFGSVGGRDALDLGFSWRMPWWNAALEFGARNLLVRPREPSPEQPKVEQGDLRVPYLRYHQEL